MILKPDVSTLLIQVKLNTNRFLRRDVMCDDGPHLSGLSDAQTESIIPTSNVPWRVREMKIQEQSSACE